MINLDILKCQFAGAVYNYIIKLRGGVECNLLEYKEAMNVAYNYYKIASMYVNNGCTISPNTYREIVTRQDKISLTIETCC